MNGSIELLRQVTNTDKLTPLALDKLISKIAVQKYRKGQVIMSGERRIKSVQRGIVKLSRITKSGDVIFKDLVYDGEIFGNFFFNEIIEEARVVSDEARILSVSFNDLNQILTDHECFSRYIGHLEKSIQETEDYLYTSMRLDVRERLIMFLQRLGRKNLSRPGAIEIEGQLTTGEIALAIFASRQSVSFNLLELERVGLIARERGKIILRSQLFERREMAVKE